MSKPSCRAQINYALCSHWCHRTIMTRLELTSTPPDLLQVRRLISLRVSATKRRCRGGVRSVRNAGVQTLKNVPARRRS
eukprot:7376194-Prymnesium_polylepis.1